MSFPSGVYDQQCRLVATRRGVPLTHIQDPDTADQLWVTPTGHIYHRERARVTGGQADVDRLNALLDEDRAQRNRNASDKVAIAITIGLTILVCILAVCRR